jgi:hypothetical protein
MDIKNFTTKHANGEFVLKKFNEAMLYYAEIIDYRWLPSYRGAMALLCCYFG